jgi:hypothetical protein
MRTDEMKSLRNFSNVTSLFEFLSQAAVAAIFGFLSLNIWPFCVSVPIPICVSVLQAAAAAAAADHLLLTICC